MTDTLRRRVVTAILRAQHEGLRGDALADAVLAAIGFDEARQIVEAVAEGEDLALIWGTAKELVRRWED